MNVVVVEAGPVKGVQQPRARRELAQEEELRRKPPKGGEAAHRALEPPVRVAEPRPDDGRPRMRVGERNQRAERALVEPGIRVEQQRIAARGAVDAGVPAERESAVLLLDEHDFREAVAHELDGAVGRAVVDHDRLDSAHAREALLEPRQPVVRDDDHGDRAHRRRSPSRMRIATPGSASAIVTMKKRKPVANAWFALTPRAPRNDTKNVSRTASPLTVNGTSITRKSSGPIT